MPKSKKRFTKHLEVISRFDQFCDYTSIIGFRLLHSENPIWIRLLTLSFLSAFCVMVLIQTRDAFQRFIDPASKPIPRFEASQTDSIPRCGLLICAQQQIASILNGYGSLDFRLLLFEYIKETPNKEFFLRVYQEFHLLENLFNSTSAELNEDSVRGARQQLQNFPEISMYLNLDRFYLDPNILLQLPNYRSFSSLQNSLDECWVKNWGKADKRKEFVRCRWEKARSLFEEFKYLNNNFFEYFQNVSWKFEDLVLNVSFYHSKFKHQQLWHIGYGLCELLKPDDKFFNESEISEKTSDDYILRTNFFESQLDASVYLFLYDSFNERVLNKINLIAGEYLEISIFGFSEIVNELCRNEYHSVCSKLQNANTTYSWDKCRWCSKWTTNICNCAVPDFYYSDITLRNCTLFESIECMIRYKKEMLKESKCKAECRSTSYVINTRQQSLEMEMLSDVFESPINTQFKQLSRAINQFYEIPTYSDIRL